MNSKFTSCSPVVRRTPRSAETNFALSHVNASCSHSVSDVASTDEPNSLPSSPVLVGRDSNGGSVALTFSCARICSSQNVSQFSFQFSARRTFGSIWLTFFL
ncbi:hypothetical protein KCP76_12340 [Salmonella enterica subsp. enterica serovar Weltevreden]|nr:hypothetical protein KCP76_12340 [Salmonella enterica subsp. enterica serovar Weltevreden]